MKAPLLTLTATVAISGCSGGATLPGRAVPQSPHSLAQTAQPRARCNWRVVTAANPNSTNAYLYGVAGDAPSDIWSVGNYQPSSSSPFRTFSERWNGSAWNLVQTRNVGTGDNNLVAVAALSPGNAWAVGISNPTPTAQTRTLIEHWDGKSWRAVTSPSPGQLSALGDVKAVSPSDIWASGFYYDLAGNSQTLVEHWNGRAWKVASSPSPGASFNSLGKLAIVSAKNIWTVGSTSNDSSNTLQTLVERWDGKTWQVVLSPNAPNAIYSDLGSVVAIDANDIWAVGSSESYGAYVRSTLVERWNGSSWQIVSSPNMGTHGSGLADIAALSANDLWSVGTYIDPSNFLSRTLIEHWNGNLWRIAKSPSPGALEDALHGITRVGTTLWSVGNQASSSENEPLITRLACH